ncbi:diguanylate cyclase [Salegentibacter salinarum]|uniref:Diguanylate cyclase n=1 Tax=Salegentibacter salinarum TaxID=447422 RepID=A0A2N0U3K7_9FLAO|nr:PAS domain-containing protein [Salegentibacter salinarum]PKD21458.1 diguanylate cyclase [Salegentibacter salinarum]SKB38399.1 PAS domain S-box-containing protein [Salegentibacter salinarum]
MKKNLMNMQCLDIYLSSLSQEEYEEIEDEITVSDIKLMPLRSWDIYNEHFANQILSLKQQKAINSFKELARKFDWKNNWNEIFKDKTFDALVLTNQEVKIQWVSEGFTDMTGYSSRFAINKTPHFLQGKDTDRVVLNRIKHKLSRDEPFTEVLVNYKKDKTPYKCEISVIPLINERTTHYLALERQA